MFHFSCPRCGHRFQAPRALTNGMGAASVFAVVGLLSFAAVLLLACAGALGWLLLAAPPGPLP